MEHLDDDDLGALLAHLNLHPDDLDELVDTMGQDEVESLLAELGGLSDAYDVPQSPIELARVVEEGFVTRPHLDHLSDRIRQAVEGVEAGKNRRIILEMPPRSGKTLLGTMVTAAWMLSRHPDWPIVLTSHDGSLAVSWGRVIRRWAEAGLLGEHVQIAQDSKAVSEWETTEGGTVLSRSVRESLTGRGAKVLILDDVHKDFVEAHSKNARDLIWNWWLSVAQTRLQPPSLVIVTMTRWHEDDIVGRLLSDEYPGDSSEWEVIRMPALAEEDDALGRRPGEPLISPIVEEDEEQALERWASVRESVGTYTWAAMYQQRPAPAEGAIFDTSWWCYWTSDPLKVTEDGRVRLLPSEDELRRGTWVDSWDTSFKGAETSDFVVGQRWVRVGAYRFLIAQQRGRWSFNQALDGMKLWAKVDDPRSPYGHLVHLRLVEDSANGPAIISALKDQISGLKPVKARTSKEARARAVTPEIESGHVILPHPSEPGYEWVSDLVSELREFPNGAHDDQVDAMTQALAELREARPSKVTVPRYRGAPRQTPLTRSFR